MDTRPPSLIPAFITEQLERLANRALLYAPLTRLQLQKLQGKTFAIELQRPGLRLLLRVTRKGLLFQSQWEDNADASVRGPAVALLRQLRQEDTSPAALIRGGIEIGGDLHLAQQFVKVLKDLDLDLESALGDLIGDVAAHQISELTRTGLGWLGRAGRTLLRQSRNYLAEERNVLLTPRQYTRFRDDVEALRESTDRLDARIARLQRQIDHFQHKEDDIP